MKTLLIAYNSETGRCFKVPEKPVLLYQHVIAITRVPDRVGHVGLCLKLEQNDQLRNQGKITYSELKGQDNA